MCEKFNADMISNTFWKMCENEFKYFLRHFLENVQNSFSLSLFININAVSYACIFNPCILKAASSTSDDLLLIHKVNQQFLVVSR